MSNLIIVRGLPGSGKSTLAKKLKSKYEKAIVFEADDFFYDEHGNYKFNNELLPLAHAQCLYNSFRWLNIGLETNKENIAIVANTFVTKKEMMPYINYCNYFGFTYSILECKGNYKSIHNVPEKVIKKMKNKWVKMYE